MSIDQDTPEGIGQDTDLRALLAERMALRADLANGQAIVQAKVSLTWSVTAALFAWAAICWAGVAVLTLPYLAT